MQGKPAPGGADRVAASGDHGDDFHRRMPQHGMFAAVDATSTAFGQFLVVKSPFVHLQVGGCGAAHTRRIYLPEHPSRRPSALAAVGPHETLRATAPGGSDGRKERPRGSEKAAESLMSRRVRARSGEVGQRTQAERRGKSQCMSDEVFGAAH